MWNASTAQNTCAKVEEMSKRDDEIYTNRYIYDKERIESAQELCVKKTRMVREGEEEK